MSHPSFTFLPKLALSLALFSLILHSLPVAGAIPAPLEQEQPPISSAQSASPQLRYLSQPSTADAVEIAKDYLYQHRFELGLGEDDLRELVVKDRYVTKHNGVTHLYLRQRLNGIEVFNGDININLTADGRIINLGNGFISGLRSRVNAITPTLSATASVQRVAPALGLTVTQPLYVTQNARTSDQSMVLNNGGIARDPIRVRLIYEPLPNGQVRLAWNMTLRLKNNQEWLDLRADAITGEILSQVNWIADSQPTRQTADSPSLSPLRVTANTAQHATATAQQADTSAYLVYALPASSPLDGDRSLLSNPADPVASPFGWHDVDGVVGPEYITTRGNNTFTYADVAAPDGFGSGDSSAEPSASLVFSYPIDLNDSPAANRNAVLSNLFYVTNQIHDIAYAYGFDEAAGNFQQNNYGRGGLGNDAVNAEGQDYDGFNNANFGTPAEGETPQMQMYLGSSSTRLTIESPPAIAGPYIAMGAAFGPFGYNQTGDVVLVDDGVATADDGCETPFVNAGALAGKIALVSRSSCSFEMQVKNAESNGAIAVLVADTSFEVPQGMGDDPTVENPTIPSMFIGLSEGNSIRDQLAVSTTVTVTLLRSQTDGSLDNDVILHEYTHGISNRLTGGPHNVNCLSQFESKGLGEGWSDFFGLALTAKATDTGAMPQPVGLWLLGQSATGPGIRSYPYTTDMNLNPQTFNSIRSYPGPHAVGSVWTSMLWEVYWKLVDRYGFDPDLKRGTGGNNLLLQLVMDGMKLQPCNPTFVEARDAILLADQINNLGKNLCPIWEGFAKRGLGYAADAGSSASGTDGSESFALPSFCMVDVQPPALDVCLPNPASFDVALGDSFGESATLSVIDMPGGTTADFSVNPLSAPQHSTLTIANTQSVLPGTYTLGVVGTGSSRIFTTSVQLHLASAAPAAPALVAPTAGITNVAQMPLLQWQAAPQAFAYQVELAEDVDFNTLVYTATVDATSLQIPFPLRSGRSYYWRVAAQNLCGSMLSAVESFTIRLVPRLLLVDDDTSESGYADARSYYENALIALHVPYDLWNTSGNIEPKTLSTIVDYSTIVWFTGSLGKNILLPTEPILQDFLEQGKCIFISAPEYVATNGITPFVRDYLGVAATAQYGFSWNHTVTGTAPVFSDLGPYALASVNIEYLDTITPTASAAVAFTGSTGNPAIYKDAGSYRSTYWGFAFESLPTAEVRNSVMQRVLQFCDFQSDLSLDHAITPQTVLRPGQPLTYTLVVSNTGVASSSHTLITATLPTILSNQLVTSSGITLAQISNAPTVWQTSDLAPGAMGLITVTGIVSPQLTQDSFLNFATSIGSQAYDLNLTNNSSQPLTLTALVPRIRLLSTSLNSPETTDNLTLAVQLDQANPYAATTVDYATSDGSAQAGSDYQPVSGTLSIPANSLSTTFAIAVVDDALVESPETFLVMLSQPKAAALGSPVSTTITIVDNDVVPTVTPTSTPSPVPTATGTPLPTATVTPVPSSTATATPSPTPTATATAVASSLQLTFTSQPPPTTTIQIGDRITYFITLTNQGGLASNLFVSATLPVGVELIPESVTPPTSSWTNRTLAVAEATTPLQWQLATLPADSSFQASFAVIVRTAEPVNVVVQGGAPGAPATVTGSLQHPILPARLYLPVVQR